MELFHRILNTAVEGGASDIHVKVGTPIIFRISRQLLAIDCPIPTEEWLNKVVEHIVPRHAKHRLEEEREVDFSYFVHGIGRFRTNLFQQRGQFALAMRSVSGGGGTRTTVPVADANYSTPAGSAVRWDRERALELFRSLRER